MKNLTKEDMKALKLIDAVATKYIKKKVKEQSSELGEKEDTSGTFKDILYNILMDSRTKNIDLVGYATSLSIFADLKNYECMEKILDSKDPNMASKLLFDIYMKDIFEKDIYQMKYKPELRELSDDEFKKLLEPFTFVMTFINQYNPEMRDEVIDRASFFSMYKPELAVDFIDSYTDYMYNVRNLEDMEDINMINIMNSSAEQDPEEFNKISIMALEKSKKDILNSDNRDLKSLIEYIDYDIQFLKDNPTKYMTVPVTDLDHDEDFKKKCTDYMLKTEDLTFWNQVYNKGYAIFY